MAEDTQQLRADIDKQRSEISGTIDQIENRVNPSHIVARRQDRIRSKLTDWKDTVFGNDEPDYPSAQYPYRYSGGPTPETGPGVGERVSDVASGVGERVSDAASTVVDTAQQAPQMMRRQTVGNPLAVGAIAVGAGWLIGSLLPETRQERQAIRRVEPQLSDAASALQQEGRDLAQGLQEPAREAVEDVKQAGQEAAAAVKDEGAVAVHHVRDQATS